MAARAAAWSLVALATLTIGVGGAVGHAAATTTTVRVQVIGRGVVSDNKSSMNCGNGATVCRISYRTGSVTFTAAPAAGRSTAGAPLQRATCDVDPREDDRLPLDQSPIRATIDSEGERRSRVTGNIWARTSTATPGTRTHRRHGRSRDDSRRPTPASYSAAGAARAAAPHAAAPCKWTTTRPPPGASGSLGSRSP
jgi:hypothetical protein